MKNVIRIVISVLAVLLLLAVGVGCALFVNTPTGYIPVFMLVFLVLFCGIDILLLLRSLSVLETTSVQGCIRGESLSFDIVLKNNSIAPATCVKVLFFVSDSRGVDLEAGWRTLTMAPRSEKVFSFQVAFEHIGQYRVGIREVKVQDFLGLFSFSRQFVDGHTVNVEPRIFDVARLSVSEEAAASSKKPITSVLNDGMDYFGVREYIWGDPIKSIHWKLSSRYEDYLTKIYETPVSPGLEIIVDFDAPNYSEGELFTTYDILVESSLSLAEYASTHGLECEVVFDDSGSTSRVPVVSDESISIGVMGFPSIRVGNGSAAVDLLRRDSQSLYSPCNIAICSATVSEGLVTAVLNARAHKKNPLLFVIVPNGIDDDAMHELKGRLSALSRAGVAYTLVNDAQILELVG